jgi:hypothetical protein
MQPLLLLSALIGATLIIVRGTVFSRVRKLWPALLGCAQCTGFWVGAGVGVSGLISIDRGRVVDVFVVGTATSFLALAADAVLLKLLGDPNHP